MSSCLRSRYVSKIKSLRGAHHTFEAKLRNASTLLRLGKTKKSCFALTLIAKFTFFFYLCRDMRINIGAQRRYVREVS